jgi:Tfp pilus assembly PilM family ATPase
LRRRADKQGVIGLEVGAQSLCAATASVEPSGHRLRVGSAERVRMAEPAEDRPSDGRGHDEELAELAAGLGLRASGARARVGVGGAGTAMRVVMVPRARRRADQAAVIAEAVDEAVPFALGESYWTTREMADGARNGNERTLLAVAARRQLVDRSIAIVSAAGWQLAGVDLAAFAAIRALPRRDEGWLGVLLGSEVSVFVAHGRQCRLVRSPDGLAERGRLVGLSAAERGRRIAEEMESTRRYQADHDPDVAVGEVVLAGPGAEDEELVTAIRDGFAGEVAVESPAGAAEALPEAPSAVTVAAGLCVEEMR